MLRCMRVPRSQFTRLEACHQNELRDARHTAVLAAADAAHAGEEAALLRRSAAALEAKRACEMEDLRGRLARAELELADARKRESRTAAANADAQAGMAVMKSSLGAELRGFEAIVTGMMNRLYVQVVSGETTEDQLGELQQQASRATELLKQQQLELEKLRKRSAADQRRALKMREQQHAADSSARRWSLDRARLEGKLLDAEGARQRAEETADELRRQLRFGDSAAMQERDASCDALDRCRKMHATEARACADPPGVCRRAPGVRPSCACRHALDPRAHRR